MPNFDLHNIPLQEQAFHTFYLLRSPEIMQSSSGRPHPIKAATWSASLEIMPRLGGI